MGAGFSSITPSSTDNPPLNPASPSAPPQEQDSMTTNTYDKVVYLSRIRFSDDEEENSRPKKLRKLHAGTFPSSSEGRTSSCHGDDEEEEGDAPQQDTPPLSAPAGLVPPSYPFTFTVSLPGADYSALAFEQRMQSHMPWPNIGELTLDCDDEESCVDDTSSEEQEYSPIPHLEHRDSLSLHRERLGQAGEGLSVNLPLDSGDEAVNERYAAILVPTHEGSGIHDQKKVRFTYTSPEGSIDDTSSSSSSSTNRLANQSIPLIRMAAATDPFGPLHSAPSSPTTSLIPFPPFDPAHGCVPHVLFGGTTRFAGGLGSVHHLPSITLTPATPRPALSPEARHSERWPGYRRFPNTGIDTRLLFVREADRDLKSQRERMLAGVRDRWAVVRRRRQRLADALRARVGGLEAWRRAHRDTPAWRDWAWSGP
ncbi:hypothetical protein CONLIGDRAFT_640171 [Coniochaeta ligniaria NRRL 30616]|uniref:Uncharacterized protein n=1 Tax=Coniochaeta ligniaria NRRL 30616 TaxID=1408157 RepID=A0A1J7JI30_9PEZI|nr:hypothetical protein CONLIGDRAFT_640171 [Coniochaeta ligniaria NRRL 30616]